MDSELRFRREGVAECAGGVVQARSGRARGDLEHLGDLHERVGFRRIGIQSRLGQDASGRWRDVVLLERRSTVSGVD